MDTKFNFIVFYLPVRRCLNNVKIAHACVGGASCHIVYWTLKLKDSAKCLNLLPPGATFRCGGCRNAQFVIFCNFSYKYNLVFTAYFNIFRINSVALRIFPHNPDFFKGIILLGYMILHTNLPSGGSWDILR